MGILETDEKRLKSFASVVWKTIELRGIWR